ncbi:MAG: hypothetical protein ACLP5H_11210, partial [Desulfomonilaceae bacterium]
YRSAWTWILLKAEWNPKGFNGLQRGQVRFSVNQAQELWGMSPTAARRFLAACVADGSISWERSKGGRPAIRRISQKQQKHGAVSARVFGAVNGAVSSKVMPSKPAPDAPRDGLSKESSKESTNKRRVPVAEAPVSPSKKSSKQVPTEPPDPRVKVLIDYFCTTYKAKLGYKYTVHGGKDGQHLKTLLIDHSLETLKAGIDTFFNNQEDWLNGKRTIGVFFSQINQCLQQTATQQTQDLPPGCPGPGYSYDEHYKIWVKD